MKRTQFLIPFYTMPPTDLDEKITQSYIWVPMDDANVVNWMVTWHPDRALTREEIDLNVAGKGAHVCDYLPATSEPYGDIRVRRRTGTTTTRWTVDRALEHLGTSDSAIIQVRKRLMNGARALRERGTPAPGRDPESFHVRSASVVLPPGASWVEGAMPRVMVKPGRQLTLA